MSAPLVTVVIPNYNYARFLGQAIDSVLAQTFRDFEVLVIDNGSTDNSIDVLRGYGNRVRWIGQENRGQAGSRNRGIEESRGKFIAFLDADDVWSTTKLEKQMPLFEDENVGLVYCGVTVTDSELEPLDVLVPRSRGRVLEEFTEGGRAVVVGGESSCIIRKECLRLTGGFDPELSLSAGWDLYRRVASCSALNFVAESLVFYRQHGENTTRNLGAWEHDVPLILDKMFADPRSSEIHSKKRQTYSRFFFMLAASFWKTGRWLKSLSYAGRAFIFCPPEIMRRIAGFRWAGVARTSTVVYVVSNVDKSLALEWTAEGLKNHCRLTFVLLHRGDSALEQFLRKRDIAVFRILYRGRLDAPKALLQLWWLLIRERPLAIHAHLIDAAVVGLIAGWLAGIKKRVYTRHNSTLHHVYHQNAIKYDRLNNHLATHIISVSQATDEALLRLENAPAHKVVRIPHGFDLEYFTSLGPERVDAVQRKWQIPQEGLRIGVVARHVEWKGIQHIIPAFKKLLKEFPSGCLVMANASGPYHAKICEMLSEIPPSNYRMIPFEEDIAALYRSFDIYVHVPIDPHCEAFGQTYIEALASGVPSIFTRSGIAAEFIEHERNALIVDFESPSQIHAAMKRIVDDRDLARHLVNGGYDSVNPRFSLRPMIEGFRRVYGT